ncbi:TPA: hypothetical protein N0F65_008818, partial [Lagenidium giganteum]
HEKAWEKDGKGNHENRSHSSSFRLERHRQQQQPSPPHRFIMISAPKLVAVVAVSAVVAPAFGYEKFLAQIPNGENFGKKLGHSGDGYTEFGKLWKECGSWATACKKTFPGTSQTCGAVLGDPCCKWSAGGKPDFELKEPNMSGTKCAAETPAPSTAPSTAPSAKPSSGPSTAPTTAPGKPTSAPVTTAPSKNGTTPATPAPTTPGSKAPPLSSPTHPDGFHHVANSNIRDLDTDVLYHLGLSCSSEQKQQIQELFGDVKFFVTGGSSDRMTKFAKTIAEELKIATPFGYSLTPIGSTARYTIFKVGPVLIANHGMGMPSVSILLHEVTKLLEYAGANDAVYIRMGTSGGVGVEAGTVVLTSEGVNSQMESVHEVAVLGNIVKRPSICDKQVTEEIAAAAQELGLPYAIGKTLTCDDFYEGQGRLDGAICEYSLEDKMAFLRTCADNGVKNIEMEARGFAAFCHKLHIPVAVICVTILNRLNGDQVTSSHSTLKGFEERPATPFIMKTTTFLSVAVLAIVSVQSVYGMEKYLEELPNGKTFAKSLGHVGGETSKLSDFAKAFQAAQLTWSTKFCEANFPGSDIKNGEAFGDPCCKWKKGDAPQYTDVKAFDTKPTEKKTCAAPGPATPGPSAGPTQAPAPGPNPAPGPSTPVVSPQPSNEKCKSKKKDY